MKPTEMPAWKLTADCIWNSFRSSGKKHLLLTGSRDSGKSTLLFALTGGAYPGITTRAVPEQGVYMTENSTGEEAKIGFFDPDLPRGENRMRPIAEGFADFGTAALARCASAEGDWVAVDEIGYLECGNEAYCAALRRLMEAKHLIAAVRKQELPFLRELLQRQDAFVIDLDRPFGNLGCVIMASGLGRRFGGSKLMVPFQGQPMIEWILRATDGIFARRVVVTRNEDAAQYCAERGVQVVFHDQPYRSDTVRLGLEAVGDTDGCMFCPADQPLLRADTVMALALSAANAPGSIWRTVSGDTPGAPILFPKWAYPELAQLPQGKGGGYAAKNHPEQTAFVIVRDGYELLDVDTPEQLAQLESMQ